MSPSVIIRSMKNNHIFSCVNKLNKQTKQAIVYFQIKGSIKRITVTNKHRKQLHYNHWKYMYK